MFVINLDFFVDFIDIFEELLYNDLNDKQKLYNILVFSILGNFENKIFKCSSRSFFLLLHRNVNSQVFSTRKTQHHEQQEHMQVYHDRARLLADGKDYEQLGHLKLYCTHW